VGRSFAVERYGDGDVDGGGDTDRTRMERQGARRGQEA
jgi:hypothetical protein